MSDFAAQELGVERVRKVNGSKTILALFGKFVGDASDTLRVHFGKSYDVVSLAPDFSRLVTFFNKLPCGDIVHNQKIDVRYFVFVVQCRTVNRVIKGLYRPETPK